MGLGYYYLGRGMRRREVAVALQIREHDRDLARIGERRGGTGGHQPTHQRLGQVGLEPSQASGHALDSLCRLVDLANGTARESARSRKVERLDERRSFGQAEDRSCKATRQEDRDPNRNSEQHETADADSEHDPALAARLSTRVVDTHHPWRGSIV